MSSIRRSLPVSLAAVAVALAGCGSAPPAPAPIPVPPPVVLTPPAVPPPPVLPKPEPAPLFTPVAFAALPGWERDDQRQAWPAFSASCATLGRKAEWQGACGAARGVNSADLAAVRGFFEAWFVPQQVRNADGTDTGLVTGYYEPLLHGARKRGGANQYPLYRVPADLLTIDLSSVYPELKGLRLRGRLVGKKVVPFGSRADLERGDLAGKELLWVDDPTDAFFLEVQGSGRVELADTGETVRVAYADQNGYPYKAIGRWLVEKGELTAAESSMQSIRAWIAANPARRQELFNANPSLVFFREERLPDPGVGPKGSLGVALSPGRSVAVDQQFIPLGVPVFLATTESNSDVPLQRLVLAQDTGGAIRGAVRADFFFGFGAKAADDAGRMKQRGSLWVLLPK